MKTRSGRGQNVAVAAFFAILGIALVGTLLLTGALDNLIHKRQKVYVAFTEGVTGLTIGSPVTFFGVRVGEVTDLVPMDSPMAKRVVDEAKVIDPKGKPVLQGGDKCYQEWTKSYTQSAGAISDVPHVLATVVVDEGALPLNETTTAELQLVNLAGSFAVKVESKPGSDPALEKRPVVILAKVSSFGSISERLLDEQKGLLRKDNVESLSRLVHNVEEITDRVRTLTSAQQQNLNQIVESTTKITQTMEEWTSGKDAKIARTLDDVQLVTSRLNRWTDDQVGQEGDIAILLKKTNRLEDDVTKIMEESKTDPNVPSLLRTGDDLGKSLQKMTEEVGRLAGAVEGLVTDNRERIERLGEDFARLARRVDGVMAQLDQDPSSVIWGRRGKELEPGK